VKIIESSPPRIANGQPKAAMTCHRNTSKRSVGEKPWNGGMAKGKINHEKKILMTSDPLKISRCLCFMMGVCRIELLKNYHGASKGSQPEGPNS
jgi:hypothetical protein